jgi:hypothetical protein
MYIEVYSGPALSAMRQIDTASKLLEAASSGYSRDDSASDSHAMGCAPLGGVIG